MKVCYSQILESVSDDSYSGSSLQWVIAPIEGNGETYSFSAVHKRDYQADDSWPDWESIESACGSDYSGGSVNRANFLWFEEHYGDHPEVAFLYGDYSSYGVLVPVEIKDEELRDVVHGLDDYPLVDDEALSRLESEWQNEAFSDTWNDIQRAIESTMNDSYLVDVDARMDALTEDQRFEFVRQAMDALNLYWEYEYASAYLPSQDRIVNYLLGDDDFRAIVGIGSIRAALLLKPHVEYGSARRIPSSVVFMARIGAPKLEIRP